MCFLCSTQVCGDGWTPNHYVLLCTSSGPGFGCQFIYCGPGIQPFQMLSQSKLFTKQIKTNKNLLQIFSSIVFSHRNQLQRTVSKMYAIKSEGFLNALKAEVHLMTDMVSICHIFFYFLGKNVFFISIFFGNLDYRFNVWTPLLGNRADWWS